MQIFCPLFFAYKRIFFSADYQPTLGTLTFFKIFFFFLYTLNRKFAPPIGSFSLFDRLICFTMAIIKNGLSMMMRGKVGAFSYYVSETRQIVRQAQNNSNFGATATRSPGQQSRRVVWANLVNFYSGNKGWMKKAFEDLKPGVSVFNRFMQLNIPYAQVALTKQQAADKVCVLQQYQVSQGSLVSPLSSEYNENAYPNIVCEIDDDTAKTVAIVSRAIIDQNDGYLNGDAIVGVSFKGSQKTPANYKAGNFRAGYKYYEVVLDVNDNRMFAEVYPDWGVLKTGLLACTQMSGGAYTFIHTRKASGKLLVSTSFIMMSEDAIANVAQWGNANQVANATESYKVEEEVVLNPGGDTRGDSSTDTGGSTPGGGGGGDDDENLGE